MRYDKPSALWLTDPILEKETGVDPESGRLRQMNNALVNFIPVPVTEGSVLHISRADLNCSVYYYSKQIPEDLIHTYAYDPESNWSTYRADWCIEKASEPEVVLKHEGYIRLVFTGAEKRKDPIRLHEYAEIRNPKSAEEARCPDWINQEAAAVAERVDRCKGIDDLAVLLLTDTHDTLGGIWENTHRSLRETANRISPDAIIHLGDFADGLLPAEYTKLFVKKQLEQLREIHHNLYCCIGNHDRNAFRGNQESFSARECAELYLQRKQTWYYIDKPENKVRLFFLGSFNPNQKERYGFDSKEVLWFALRLWTTPPDYKVVIFSHVTPLAQNHVWSKTIRNGERMLRIIQGFQRIRKGCVLGWIHGHNHADQITWYGCLPVIGIGCAKLEDFTEHKPEGAVTWPRAQCTASEELWDVLVIHPKEESMDFIRFGAGEDRHINQRQDEK